MIRELAKLVQDFTHEVIPDPQRTFFALALGKLQAAPFSESQMQELRTRWFKLLPAPSEAARVPEGQPFFLRAIAQTARLMGKRMLIFWTQVLTTTVTEGWLAMATPSRGCPWSSGRRSRSGDMMNPSSKLRTATMGRPRSTLSR